MNIKVVSIALFGSGEGYAEYLSTFALAHNNLFPSKDGWRLYLAVIDSDLSLSTKKLIGRLHSAGLLNFEVHPPAPLCKAMLYRMQPVFDPGVDFVFCRDLDAIPMPRDRACCDAFVANAEKYRCATHTIHDSQYHIGIMGGLCGFQAPMLRAITRWNSLEDIYAAAGYSDAEWAQKGADQLALNKLLLHATGPRLFEHRFNGWHGGPGAQPARAAGQYACSGVSSPVTDGHIIDETPAAADLLGKHLGCAGYDIAAARKFWLECGDQEIADKIRRCE